MASLSGQFMRKLGQWLPSAALRGASRPAALLFHGVEIRIDDPRIQVVHHQRDVFYNIAKSLKENFQILPLAALDEVLKAPGRHQRSMFLMSDDGYVNNLTVAADILDELRIPWTLFISTQHIGTGERNPLFIARLFVYFAPEGRYPIPNLVKAVEVASAAGRKKVADRVISELKALEPAKAKQAIGAMTAILSEMHKFNAIERFPSEAFLTWQQVGALHQRGVEIGAHAHWHGPMHGKVAEHLREQAQIPRREIESKVGRCRFFAYPFGTRADI
jgi:peptidoglycan/xylan/chitin deacetylase (PgdA/CDA1 family)